MTGCGCCITILSHHRHDDLPTKGWIKPCPQELGWLQPSAIITAQEIPAEGFPEPASDGLAKWGIELLIGGIYSLGGICMLVYTLKKDKPLIPILSGVTFLAAGWYFYHDGWKMSYALLTMGVLFPAIGVARFIRRRQERQGMEDGLGQNSEALEP